MPSSPVLPEPPCDAAFAGYRFALDSGELTDPHGVVRPLARQPAALLGLLLGRGGEVVSREEIRRALWPEVTVDFDQGVAFCVRQIRAALAEPAGTASLVETLPKRGYRLRAAVDWQPRGEGARPVVDGENGRVAYGGSPPPAAGSGCPAAVAAPSQGGPPVGLPVGPAAPVGGGGDRWSPRVWRRPGLRSTGLVLVAVLVGGLGVGLLARLDLGLIARLRPTVRPPVGPAIGPAMGPAAERQGTVDGGSPAGIGPGAVVRVAIMPFALVAPSPAAPLTPAEDPRRVAGELLATLPGRLAGLAGVIGPTTTEAYADRPDPAAVLAGERGVAYLVNGRLLATVEGPRLLVEVIRTSDGVHVWVRRYALDAAAAAIAAEVADGLLAELGPTS